MNFDSADVPPIPTRAHGHHAHGYGHSRRRSLQGPSSSKRASSSVPPASPEVISNLITSLSVISQPATSHFEASPHSLSLPSSPGRGHGSFGVDYGAFHQPSLDDLRQDPVSLDELAALPPVIRTSKPPSGYSPLTAAKSPKSPRSPSRESGGLRSFIRNSTSRPSSKGSSQASKNDDTHSIGNLSIERRSSVTPDLNHKQSHDSWGKKTSRSSKGLMYMSSRERLREKEAERKRVSGGISASSSGAFAGESVYSDGRNDPFFAETAIREESQYELPIERPMEGPCAIPARGSSLTKTGQSKRSSGRRSKWEDGSATDAIPEGEEHQRPRERETGRRKEGHSAHQSRSSTRSPVYGLKEASPSQTTSVAGRSFLDVSRDDDGFSDEEDEGAPFPAVAQNRKRDQSNDRHDRRRSGQPSPVPAEGVKVKRSSSRLKRLSEPLNLKSEERTRESLSPQPPVQNHTRSHHERPQSADSVDDAVDSYLCSPRLSQKIRHPQTGRVISFSEVGDSEGSAVFCCVGMGLTRYITAFYDELALTLKLRLITPDRPGVGDSEPYSDGTATPLSWPGKSLSLRRCPCTNYDR